ncbi:MULTISPECIES: hypothetical protein [unclassified Aeromonas]|uniref:hypothetical protein n=1 Tax=unclassified Aeromonas TaxID=257493 RepID=UPI0035275D65
MIKRIGNTPIQAKHKARGLGAGTQLAVRHGDAPPMSQKRAARLFRSSFLCGAFVLIPPSS